MTDSLRDKIAAALFENSAVNVGMKLNWALAHDEVKAAWRRDADEVIAALGLNQEQRELMDGMCGQSINYLSGKVTNHYRAATRQHRYVTEWENDE